MLLYRVKIAPDQRVSRALLHPRVRIPPSPSLRELREDNRPGTLWITSGSVIPPSPRFHRRKCKNPSMQIAIKRLFEKHCKPVTVPGIRTKPKRMYQPGPLRNG